MPELVFTVPRGRSTVGSELAAVLSERVAAQDAASTVVEGRPPGPLPDRVYVAVQDLDAPHGEQPAPPPERTIHILLAPPGTAAFDRAIPLVREAAAVLHVNGIAVGSLHAEEIPAKHLQLGYAPVWRRLAPQADSAEVAVIEGASGYLDWPRVLRAIHGGAVVLHGRALGFAPLVPGRHFFVAAEESLEVVAAALRSDPSRLAGVREEALAFLRTALPLDLAASALLGVARGIVAQPPSVSALGLPQC